MYILHIIYFIYLKYLLYISYIFFCLTFYSLYFNNQRCIFSHVYSFFFFLYGFYPHSVFILTHFFPEHSKLSFHINSFYFSLSSFQRVINGLHFLKPEIFAFSYLIIPAVYFSFVHWLHYFSLLFCSLYL